MKTKCAKALLALICLVTISPSVVGQHFSIYGDQNKPQDVFFVTDYAVFRSDSTDGGRLEVYYQIHNPILKFVEDSGLFVAEYLLKIEVLGKDDTLVGSFRRNREVKVPTKNKTRSHYDYRTNQVNFELFKGKYKVKFLLRDFNSDVVIERDFDVKVPDFNHKTAKLSDIELVQAAGAIDDKPSKFDKGNLTLIPAVSSDYGDNNAWKLKYYTEIYQGQDSADEIRVETVVRHRLRGMLYRDSLTSTFNSGIIRELREISLDRIKPGDYELQITLRGKRNKKIDVKHRDFSMLWSERAYLKFDFNTIIRQLQVIVTSDETKELKGMENYEDRVKAFDEFWYDRDPTPGTPINEVKREFYRRVRVANANFRVFTRDGWKTDRGRVYLLLGEPDQIDDYALVSDSPPYQRWHYYHGSRARSFLFVDFNSDGEYRLQYPLDGLNLRPEF